MHRELSDILACPVCLAPLHLDGAWREPVIEGTLSCRQCANVYDIGEGLPLLLLKDRYWEENRTEAESERELVDELPLREHIKRNRFEAQRSLRLLSQVHLRKAPLILDVGGSSGLGAYLFKRYNAQVVIIDIVPHLLKIGEVSLRGRMDASLALAGMEWLPFRANTFDAVFCRQALHHSADPASVIREFLRVTRIGGKVLIASEPCVPFWNVLIRSLTGIHFSKPSSKAEEIMQNLPDIEFLHTWKDYENWMEAVTDRFRVEPAGGSAGLISTPNGLVYHPYATAMSPCESVCNNLFFGRKGFRGDINVIGTKMQEVQRLHYPPADIEPVRRADIHLPEFTEWEASEYRRLFPMMFPFQVEG